MTYGIKVEGLKKLMRNTPDHLLSRPMRRFFTSSAISVQRRSKTLAPIDTGRLRQSITYEIDGAGIPAWAKVGTNVEYAPYQEFGTSRGIRPKRFMRGGLEDSVGDIRGFLAQAAKEIEARWQT